MKIVSLLPSATEIVYALGLGDSLVGVSEECDYPRRCAHEAGRLADGAPARRAPLGARDRRRGARQMAEKEPLYVLDTELIAREQPDVILAQDLCRVCAVPSGQVQRALDEIGAPEAKVLSLDPHTLGDVLDEIARVGKGLGEEAKANELGGRAPRAGGGRQDAPPSVCPRSGCSHSSGRARPGSPAIGSRRWSRPSVP